ncbi:MAG: hypothetical protein DRQ55_04085 [Planctomycetota bacterium]|nr:MAG: hypothetical protein DRQ55_04085 [Planctomycetota bacterium]
MPPLVQNTLRSLTIGACLLIAAADLPAQPSLLVYDFTLELEPAANVERVRSLGFAGLVTRVKHPTDLVKLAGYARYIATLDDFRLIPFVVYDFSSPSSPDIWRQALPILAGADAPLWVIVRQAPSTLAVRQLLQRMARESQTFGVRTVIYPHWNTDIETAAEAAALIEQIGHPNLMNSLHTYHEIRGGNQDDMQAVAAEHARRAVLVGIAGADEDAYVGPPGPSVNWDDAIKPLDEGDYSLLPFLQALQDAGYDGPVILQTFGISDNPGHLRRSLHSYAEYTEALVPADD